MNEKQLKTRACRDVIRNNKEKLGEDIFKTDEGLEIYRAAKKQVELENTIFVSIKCMKILKKINIQHNYSNDIYSKEYWDAERKMREAYQELSNLGYEQTLENLLKEVKT